MVKHKGIRVGKRKKATPPKEPFALNYERFSELALLAPMVSWGIATAFACSFATDAGIRVLSFWATVLITLAVLCAFYVVEYLQLLHPKPEYSNCSGLGKSFKLLGYGISLSITIWINCSATIPMLFTLALGDRGEKLVMVARNYQHLRRGCHYQILPLSRANGPFNECITRTEYAILPDGPFLASFDATSSKLGYYIHDFNYPIGTIEYGELPK